jgi:putative FmdB family regulatory protein
MPLYEYECQACGHRFEVIQKYSDSPIETCVKCGGPVEKLVSSPAIQFKGSGWYITDYARAKEPSKESKESGESKKESKESKESGESKESSGSKEPSESKESKESKKSTDTSSAPAASSKES